MELPKLLKEVIINVPEGKLDRVLNFQLRHRPSRPAESLHNGVVCVTSEGRSWRIVNKHCFVGVRVTKTQKTEKLIN